MPRWLLPLVLGLPVAVVAARLGWSPLIVFIGAALALIPAAGSISSATETLAAHTSGSVGGLLNATFGNAPEVIVGIAALRAGLPSVVRASIAGSLIGNALLVLGSCMLVGGWRHGAQRFDTRAVGQYATMLALSVVGLAVPSVAMLLVATTSSTPAIRLSARGPLSTAVAVVLLATYGAYIAFAIFAVGARTQASSASPAHAGETTPPGAKSTSHQGRLPRSGHGAPPLWGALVLLAVATALTAVASETLVGAIEPVTREVGLGAFFVGLIVLPLVGNTTEYVSAVSAAMDNRMEIAMAITAGASIQVALLVAPVLVIVSAFIGPVLTLDFNPLELAIFALVALLYPLVSQDGESTWLEGVQLIAFYIIVGASAYFVAAGLTP